MPHRPSPSTAVAELPGTLVHPAMPGTRRLTVHDLWRIPRVGAPAPSPDATCCVVPVTTYTMGEDAGVTRLWLVPSDSMGSGAPRPLTSPDAIAAVPAWSPDGARLAFTRKPAGDADARAQLHVLRLDGGEPERVTDLPLGVMDAVWLPDGSGLVIVSKLIDGHLTIDATAAEIERRRDDPVKAHATEARLFRFWDQWHTAGEVPHLLHLDLATGAYRDLAPASVAPWLDFMEPAGQVDVAPGGDEVAYAAITHNPDSNEVESNIYRVPLAGGEPECLTTGAPAHCFRPRYTPDGAAIVYGRTEDRYFYADRRRIHRFDRATGADAPWCTDWDQGPTHWQMASDGTLVFTAEDRARMDLYALDSGADTPRLVAEGGTLATPRPAADGNVYFQAHSLQAPPEIHRCPLAGGAAERVTRFTAEALDGVAIGAVHEIEVPGAEGEPVQSYLVLPPDHDPSTPAPFVNMVHGGPHGASGDSFHFRWNAHVFAAPGYVVAMPNFQGSTGWGTDFARRIQGEWADRPFRDVMAVGEALCDSGLVDPSRMAAAGGSYGGYMMAWIAGHTDRFRCIVNHAGVYNTLSMYGTDITQGRHRSFGGEPWDGLDKIDRSNPARHTADMTTPMLVIHGEKDYRVPVGQGLECYGVLRAKGVPARLLHFPDENHWVLKPHNAVRWHDEVLGWLDRWLGTS